MTAPAYVHAAAVVVRDAGVLVRGRSGAGKSRLAEEIAADARARGWFGRLIGDDRIGLVRRGGRIVLGPHPAIAGLVERRGQGICPVEHERAAVLRLVVDLVEPDEPPPARLPDPEDRTTEIDGARVPRLALPAGLAGGGRVVIDFIATEFAQN